MGFMIGSKERASPLPSYSLDPRIFLLRDNSSNLTSESWYFPPRHQIWKWVWPVRSEHPRCWNWCSRFQHCTTLQLRADNIWL